ncbi:MAG TPA: sialidase family protein, partial [Terriglobales bacterium]
MRHALMISAILAFALAAAAPAQTAHAVTTLSCSPAPCVLPPTQASEGGGFQTDPTVTANPKNAQQLLLGGVDYDCAGPSNVAVYFSVDGGSAWTRVDCMPGLEVDKRNYTAVVEPHVGYDAKGSTYSAGVYNVLSGNGRHGLVAVQRSTNGTTWGTPAPALLQPSNTSFYLTHMSVDASPTSPRAGEIYVSGVFVSKPGTQVMVAHSNDGGDTWTQVAVDSVQQFPYSDAFTRMAVGKNGTVYVTWLGGKGNPCPLMLSTSSDGGNTWSTPRQIAEVNTAPSLPHTGERVYDYPSIAVDNSDGPYAGNLYVVMYDDTGTYLKVQMIRSTDGGSAWSKPLRLAPESDTHDQFFPAISANKDGLVGVSWLDRRNDPKDIDYQAFAAISYDGGQTFGPNWQLTTAFSNPTTGNPGWIGDYTGNTWVDDKFIAAWMD